MQSSDRVILGFALGLGSARIPNTIRVEVKFKTGTGVSYMIGIMARVRARAAAKSISWQNVIATL